MLTNAHLERFADEYQWCWMFEGETVALPSGMPFLDFEN